MNVYNELLYTSQLIVYNGCVQQATCQKIVQMQITSKDRIARVDVLTHRSRWVEDAEVVRVALQALHVTPARRGGSRSPCRPRRS